MYSVFLLNHFFAAPNLEEHKAALSARDKKLQTAKTMPLPAKLEKEAYEALQKLHSRLVTEQSTGNQRKY